MNPPRRVASLFCVLLAACGSAVTPGRDDGGAADDGAVSTGTGTSSSSPGPDACPETACPDGQTCVAERHWPAPAAVPYTDADRHCPAGWEAYAEEMSWLCRPALQFHCAASPEACVETPGCACAGSILCTGSCEPSCVPASPVVRCNCGP